jgi:hypothetical protein
MATARVVAHPVFRKQKSVAICEIFLEGVPNTLDIEGNIFYGVTELNAKAWTVARNKLQQVGTPYYYIDNSYFDKARNAQYRVSKNSLQFKGPSYESDGSRFAALGYTLKPWRSIDEGHIVVCPQSKTFMEHSLGGRVGARKNNRMWLPETVDALKRRWPGREIRVREWSSNKPEQMRSLPDDLAGAGLLATHSSAAAVEAVIEGIPVMVGAVSALHGLVCSGDNDQRLRFLNALADNQWTLNEIKNGDAWRWLNR